MALTRSVALVIAIAAIGCGGASTSGDVADAPTSSGCRSESDCSAPAPYCEPSTSTCVQCRFSSHCSSMNGVCEAQQCRAARSCKELKAELPGLQSGVYRIDLDGAGELAPIDTYCEMTVDGGGWTLIQRTRWQWATSMVLHTGFDAWHDTTLGTPAIGNAFRVAGMHWPALAADGELMVSHRVRTTAGTACNPLWYIGRGATFAVDHAAKSVSLTGLDAPVPMISNTLLSTADSGPDSAVCVGSSLGVPWFYASCCATCPTYQGSYWNDEPHPMTGYVADQPDFFGKVETDVCAGQTPRISDTASAFRGIDTMEMYVR